MTAAGDGADKWRRHAGAAEFLNEEAEIEERHGAELQYHLPVRAAPPGDASGGRLAEMERQAIVQALRDSDGNRRQAARILGISLRTLQYRLKDSRAYVTSGTEGLLVYDISDPISPQPLGQWGGLDNPRGLVLVGDYVYAADVTAGLRVISVADPTVPFEVGYCDTPGRALGVAVHGSYAYVADSALRVISIADPAHPVEVAGEVEVADGNPLVKPVGFHDLPHHFQLGYNYTFLQY